MAVREAPFQGRMLLTLAVWALSFIWAGVTLSRMGAFPANRISRVTTKVEPTTAES